LTADTDDCLEVGSAMINAIINQSEEANKWAIVTHNGNNTKRLWCENCGKQGHKFFECPEKIISIKSKNKIVCQYCQSTNHPSNDCPEKAKSRHLQNALTNGVDPKSNQLAIEANRMLSVEDELKEFMDEIQRDKDEKEKIKMITHEAIASNA